MSSRISIGAYRLKHLISNSLKEDVGSGDITTELLAKRARRIRAGIFLKEDSVVAGFEIAEKVFKMVDKNIVFKVNCEEGSAQKSGMMIATVTGKAQSILTAERTALNFITHLSGIANLTNMFVNEIKPHKVKIMDTRKTTPGLRELEKYAVVLGGGYNHRMGLWDEVLIKDNHLCLQPLRKKWQVIKGLRRRIPEWMKIEVEVKNLKEFKYALLAKPNIIMLDNMSILDIKKAVGMRNKLRFATGELLLEVSGGVSLMNVRQIAGSGVDMISIGKLTHSVKATDMSLEILSFCRDSRV